MIEEVIRIIGAHVAEFSVAACVAGWVSGLIVLWLNWIVPERRRTFREPLMEWSQSFVIVTVGMYMMLVESVSRRFFSFSSMSIINADESVICSHILTPFQP